MTHRVILWTAFAAFIAIMLIYRAVFIRMVEVFGLPFAAVAILACYLLARLIHRRERGY